MKSLIDNASVKCNIANQLISIELSSERIKDIHRDRCIVDINCKQLFNRYTTNSNNWRGEENIQQADGFTAAAAAASGVSSSSSIRSAKNRFDSVIDKLERQLYSSMSSHIGIDNFNNNSRTQVSTQVNSKAVDGSNDAFLESNDNIDTDNQEMINDGIITDHNKGMMISKKRKPCYDDYDFEDPFIDDDEVIEEVEATLKAHRLQTKHEGLFLSAGNLEVFSPAKVKKSRRATGSIATASSNGNSNQHHHHTTKHSSVDSSDSNGKQEKQQLLNELMDGHSDSQQYQLNHTTSTTTTTTTPASSSSSAHNALVIPEHAIPDLCRIIERAGAAGMSRVISAFQSIYPNVSKRQIAMKVKQIATKEGHLWKLNDEYSDLVMLSKLTTTAATVIDSNKIVKKTTNQSYSPAIDLAATSQP